MYTCMDALSSSPVRRDVSDRSFSPPRSVAPADIAWVHRREVDLEMLADPSPVAVSGVTKTVEARTAGSWHAVCGIGSWTLIDYPFRGEVMGKEQV